MNEFVHTFSAKRLITEEEHTSLFGGKQSLFFRNRIKNIWVLKGHEGSGLRAEIRPLKNDDPLRLFNSEHPRYEIEIIVTLAKLLNPDTNLGGLTTKDEIELACKNLGAIVKGIEEISKVNLFQKAKLYRVDLTKDIITPNDLYTHEIIRAAKKSIDRYGYEGYDPRQHLDYTFTWKDEDSMMFKSKKVWGKLYNKRRDLSLNKCQSEIDRLGDYGLLRFEISILRDILRDDYGAKGYITSETLPQILHSLTADGNMLLDKYFVKTFYKGAMLSKSILKKRLKCEKGLWSKTVDSMINFSDWVTQMKPKDLKFFDIPVGISIEISRFANLNLSPVQVSKLCPYIPSFSDMLNETIDDWLLNFAWGATYCKQKELVYWNFG